MCIKSELTRKILLIIVAHMGDAVLATPVTRALRRKYPQAAIDMLVSPLGEEASEHNPYINDTIVYSIKNWQRDRIKLRNLITFLQNQKYDLALATNYGSLGPMLAWLSAAKYRIGFDDDGGAKFLTHVVASQRAVIRHETQRQLEILRPLGVFTQDFSIEFNIAPDELTSLHNKVSLSHHKPAVVLCPFSSHPHKNWTVSGWISLLPQLAKLANCYFIGGHRELSDILQLNAYAGYAAEVLASKLTLGETAQLIREADLLITVDTGPLHIAQAFQTPVLALFGPTHPKVWGPRGLQDIVVSAPQACSPCWQRTNYWHFHCEKHECMEQITATEVLHTAEAMLKKGIRTNM